MKFPLFLRLTLILIFLGAPRCAWALPDHYAALEIAPYSDDATIRSAYRKLALKWHPDKNRGDKAAEERFKEINEAYETLSNEAERTKYDAQYSVEFAGTPKTAAPQGTHTDRAPDHYATLGLSRDANDDDIRKGYKALAMKWHPDKNLDNKLEAEERFKEIAEAYAVLSDHGSRYMYDTRNPNAGLAKPSPSAEASTRRERGAQTTVVEKSPTARHRSRSSHKSHTRSKSPVPIAARSGHIPPPPPDAAPQGLRGIPPPPPVEKGSPARSHVIPPPPPEPVPYRPGFIPPPPPESPTIPTPHKFIPSPPPGPAPRTHVAAPVPAPSAEVNTKQAADTTESMHSADAPAPATSRVRFVPEPQATTQKQKAPRARNASYAQSFSSSILSRGRPKIDPKKQAEEAKERTEWLHQMFPELFNKTPAPEAACPAPAPAPAVQTNSKYHVVTEIAKGYTLPRASRGSNSGISTFSSTKSVSVASTRGPAPSAKTLAAIGSIRAPKPASAPTPEPAPAAPSTEQRRFTGLAAAFEATLKKNQTPAAASASPSAATGGSGFAGLGKLFVDTLHKNQTTRWEDLPVDSDDDSSH